MKNKTNLTFENRCIREQLEQFIRIILLNPHIKSILEHDPFPDNANWYLGAGCLAQTVWNYVSGYGITKHIKDYDLVYFSTNLSKSAELKEQRRVRRLFPQLKNQLDVVNEARVHLWYEKDFGRKIPPFKSAEEAISTWPTTATAIGVRKPKSEIDIYAPYGLNDLFGMLIKPNKPHTLRKVYLEKTTRWKKNWPLLNIAPWEYPEK